MPTDALYEQDFTLWAEQQGKELQRVARAGSNLPINWGNVAEDEEWFLSGTYERMVAQLRQDPQR